MDHYFSMLKPDMKALVVNALGHGFDFEDVEIAAPVGREVLVDVQASGLCHTDLLFATHDIVPTPCVLGHEVAGIVAAIGPDVAHFRVGDHVVGIARAVVRSVRSMSLRAVLPMPISGVDTAPNDRCPTLEPEWRRVVPGFRAWWLCRTGTHS
jgi:NADPH:quinone reductase-like Zn-dependent oxidoreductase